MKKNYCFLIFVLLIVGGYVHAQRDFTFDDIENWTGTGQNRAMMIIDWQDGIEPESMAWGYYFNGSVTGEEMINDIASCDPRLEAAIGGGFLNDIIYDGLVSHTGIGGTGGFYWSTWSGSNSGDWEMNAGLSTQIENDLWFGCSYTDFNPALEPGIPDAAPGLFAPPAGQPGSNAIHADSNIIKSWASNCQIIRGMIDISDPGQGKASYGEEQDGAGSADNAVVSLGDAGEAILTFETPIANGPGYDFAVFENGFEDYFLELAFVEVSSDGINYFRFPSISLSPAEEQIGGFDTLHAEYIYNLAGKYRVMYGTPFDLEELSGNENLNTDSVCYVKLVDVVGSIQTDYSSYDSEGKIINDPWPTPFASSGFDLDAVGVINMYNPQSMQEFSGNETFIVYPVPASMLLNIEIGSYIYEKIILVDVNGNTLLEHSLGDQKISLNIQDIPDGMYMLMAVSPDQFVSKKVVIQH